MLSMTGYGEAQAHSDRLQVEVAVRGVNHRFLDLAVRIADDLRPHEARLKQAVAARVQRGRVEIRVELRRSGDSVTSMELDRSILESLSEIAEELHRKKVVGGLPTFGDLLRFPDLLRVHRDTPRLEEVDIDLVLGTVDEALASFVASRVTEGDKLRALLEARLELLAKLSDRLEGLSAEASRQLAENLRRRVEELGRGVALPEERLAQEILVLLERADVREELDRLRTHIDTFGEVLNGDGPSGKRLDFLAQEILRELNTLAAKCRNTAMVGSVLEGKLICEQLREQVQNVE